MPFTWTGVFKGEDLGVVGVFPARRRLESGGRAVHSHLFNGA